MQVKQQNTGKRLADMIRYKGQKQPNLVGFETPFERDLDGENRWVKLGECVPWDELAQAYYRKMSSGMGRPAWERGW